MTQPAKRPSQPSTPVLKQRTASSLLGSGGPKQSSLTSFFQASKAAQGNDENISLSPLTKDTVTLRIDDFDDIPSDALVMDEDEILKPGKLLASGPKARASVITDDPEDTPMDVDAKSLPLPLPLNTERFTMPRNGAQSLATVPCSPLATFGSPSILPKNGSAKRNKSGEQDEEGRGGEEGRYRWLVDVKDENGNRPGDPGYDPRTLFIPPSQWNKFTPFEKQFWEIKRRLMDTVVFFKKGKFYELYEDDADIGAQRFDLKMTDRVNMRMVGVPEATFDWWTGKFVAAGYRIARVDQTETSISKSMKDRENRGSKAADKIIKRELSTILTSGTLVDSGLLTSDLPTYCMSVKEGSSCKFGIAFVDASTASFHLCSIDDDQSLAKLTTLLMQIRPKEVVLQKGNLSGESSKLIKTLLPNVAINNLAPLQEFWDGRKTWDEIDRSNYFETCPTVLVNQMQSDELSFSAFGGLLSYLRSLKLDQSLLSYGNVNLYDPIQKSDRLLLDGQTLVNLDVLVNSCLPNDSTKGTLFGLLDHCLTPFGRRQLKLWVCHPLQSIDLINERLDAVEYLLSQSSLLGHLDENLKGLPDLERLLSRIHSGSIKLKDFILVVESFKKILAITGIIIESIDATNELSRSIQNILKRMPDFEQTLNFFLEAFDFDLAKREGNIIPSSNVNDAFDQANAQMNQINDAFADHLREQQRSLKCSNVRYKDLGKELFQLEVPSNIKVPSDFILMSKTKAVNRYWNSTIKDLVRRFQEAEVRRNESLQSIFSDILQKFSQHSLLWRQVLQVVADLDCLASLAKCSENLSEPKCRPVLHNSPNPFISMEDLRHPCITPAKEASFISNDIHLGEPASGKGRMIILTGPNMGGKSTLLRQTCLSVIMAQVGCFVPASACHLTPVDRIFTRLGANDNIFAGHSTFMVELSETSKILHEATNKSLVILDELGRGTSTFDGLAIAQAVLYYLIEKIGCLGLFATHYRQLAMDHRDEAKTRCFYMACDADNANKRIIFLYKLTPGISPKSYGMNVAALAGIPREIIEEADLVAEQFEKSLSLSERTHDQQPIKALDLFKLLLTCQ